MVSLCLHSSPLSVSQCFLRNRKGAAGSVALILRWPFWNLYGKWHQVALDNNGDVVKSQLAGKRPLWSLKRQETRPRAPASLPQSHCHVSPRLGNKGLTALTKALKTQRQKSQGAMRVSGTLLEELG